MKIIRDIEDFKEKNLGYILTIGNFDGIHLGHQKLLYTMCQKRILYNKPIMVMLFEPQPLEFLSPKIAPSRITRLREKLNILYYWKINTVLCIRFNNYFSSMHPMTFIEEILIKKLGISTLIIGNDFHFGSNRTGNIPLLKNLFKIHKLKIIIQKPIYNKQIKISSTKIREALINNDFKLAKLLLGRSFSISGRVMHGYKKGRTIGYPTANVFLHKNQKINNGVYIVKVKIPTYTNKKFIGIANIGIKPTIPIKHKQLEVHLLNMNINLYGKFIKIYFYKKIRNEHFFPSLETLKQQIFKDIQTTKNYFLK